MKLERIEPTGMELEQLKAGMTATGWLGMEPVAMGMDKCSWWLVRRELVRMKA